jgi:oligoribonuclease (3'-5' exoribonuclease)
MMDETVFSLIYRHIREEKAPLVDHLVQGGAKSYEDYVRVSARHTALVDIEESIKELEKRFMEQ